MKIMHTTLLLAAVLASGCETWEARVFTASDRAGNKPTETATAFSETGCQKKLSAMRDTYREKGIEPYHWECQITSCWLC